MSTLFIFIGIGTVTHWVMRALDKLGQAEGEPDVKTIRELAALMKELNQLMKISGESESGEATLQVQWGEEAEPWSE